MGSSAAQLTGRDTAQQVHGQVLLQVPSRGLLRAPGLESTGLHTGGFVPVHAVALTGDAMPRELSAEFQGKAGTCLFRPVFCSL